MLIYTPAVHRGGLTHRVCGHCHKDVHVLPGITDTHFMSGIQCTDGWNTGGGMEYFESKYEWCPECNNFGEDITVDNLAEYAQSPDLMSIIDSEKPLVEKMMLVMHKLQPHDFARLRDVYWYYCVKRDERNVIAWRRIWLATFPKPEQCSLDMLLLTLHLYRLDDKMQDALELECFLPKRPSSLTAYSKQLYQRCVEELTLCKQNNTDRFATIEHKKPPEILGAPNLRELSRARQPQATMTCNRCHHRQPVHAISDLEEQVIGEYSDGFIHGWELAYFDYKYEVCEKCGNAGLVLTNTYQLNNNPVLRYLDKNELSEKEYLYRSMYLLNPCKETLRDLYWLTDINNHPDAPMYRKMLIKMLENDCHGFEELRLLADCYRREGNFKKARGCAKHPRAHARFTPSQEEELVLQFIITLCDSKIQERAVIATDVMSVRVLK